MIWTQKISPAKWPPKLKFTTKISQIINGNSPTEVLLSLNSKFTPQIERRFEERQNKQRQHSVIQNWNKTETLVRLKETPKLFRRAVQRPVKWVMLIWSLTLDKKTTEGHLGSVYRFCPICRTLPEFTMQGVSTKINPDSFFRNFTDLGFVEVVEHEDFTKLWQNRTREVTFLSIIHTWGDWY